MVGKFEPQKSYEGVQNARLEATNIKHDELNMATRVGRQNDIVKTIYEVVKQAFQSVHVQFASDVTRFMNVLVHGL